MFGMDYSTPRGNIKHIDFYHGGFKEPLNKGYLFRGSLA